MPYNSIKELPRSIKKVLPKQAQIIFMNVVNKMLSKGKSDAYAFRVAWGVVKKKFKKKGDVWVARSKDFVPPEFFEFLLEPTGKEIVINDEEGNLVLDAILADTSANDKGLYYDLEDLEKIANQINSYGSTLPDVGHETWDSLSKEYLYQYLNDEEILKRMKERKGVFTDIKALVKEGKLWIRAKLDKRYKNHIKRFNGLSIETLARRERLNNGEYSKRLSDPIYMGFTFTNKPALKSAKILK